MVIKKLYFPLIVLTLGFGACHKANTGGQTGASFSETEASLITDFTNKVAISEYSTTNNAATALYASISTLNNDPSDASLAQAQTAWKSVRVAWEQCEGFLFGPVEDNDYDPNTDTWPTDYTQMDSLLASSNPLETTDVEALPQSLRGYHPIEYMIFGVGGSRKASDLTDRQKKYLGSLAADLLYNNVTPLYNSWTSGSSPYANQVLTAGNGSTVFATKRDLFKTLVQGMSDICTEVGEGKMSDPFMNHDSTLCESPYSGNTLADFKNNIIGLQNVYLGLNGGTGVSNLVAVRNKDLDSRIKTAITSAISSFDNITVRYELAIYTQRTACQQVMTQLAALKTLLDGELTDYMQSNVTD